nr:PTS-dependent dihydroxyacetone kinase phosphotransferase subunit DhaM [Anaerolineales bacterium]
MVGLVIVSHSAQLAEGVAELARGMAPDTPIAAVGGLDLPERPLGTDAALIEAAIRRVYSPDGVLVLMDLGSAIMSTEFARDELPADWQAHILLCEAPLVEGAVAAATQARLGSSLAQVAEEARAALLPKLVHLAPAPPPALAAAAAPALAAAETTLLTVPNRLGLHARPAARFVQTAGRFQAEVRVRNQSTGRGPASAKSLNGVATLGARQGHLLEITAAGPEAGAALAALRQLAAENFGDEVEAPPPAPAALAAPRPAAGLSWAGLAASPGIALGPVRRLQTAALAISEARVTDPERAWEALLEALAQTRLKIEVILNSLRRRGNIAAAEIFEAHLLFLEDESLRAPARQAIFDEYLNPAAAWQRAAHAAADQFRSLEDEYQRARAVDLEDLGRQVAAVLLDVAPVPALTGAGILVAADLSPADTAALDPQLVRGLATALGGPTSHSAILARSLGLPAVVGLGEEILSLPEGTDLILDGDSGLLWPAPSATLVAEYRRRQTAAQAAAAAARAASAQPAVTRDGRRIEVAANIGSAADARAAVAAGAEGVGLFRTEFLFLDRRTAPDEDEQY